MLGPQRPDTQAFEDAAQATGIDLKVVHHAISEIEALYQAPMVLIRPDQIVAWRGHNGLKAQAILAQVLAHKALGE